MAPSDHPSARGRRTALRGGLALASAALGAALVWALWPRNVSVDPARTTGRGVDVEQLTKLAARDHRATSRKTTGVGKAHLTRYPLPADTLEQLMPLGSHPDTLRVHHPQTYYQYVPNSTSRITFWCHPTGGWTLSTNARGFRGTREVLETRPALRILVAGDSNVEGYCADEETFAHLLEGLLSPAVGGTVESLNAGSRGYSFYHYLGVLERDLDLTPDVFVVVCTAGNDFYELFFLRKYYDGVLTAQFLRDSERQQVEASTWRVGMATQFLRHVLYFRDYPQDIEVAVETAVAACVEMAELCRAHGVLFLLVLLPVYLDAQPKFFDRDPQEIRERHSLTPRQLHSPAIMAQSWMEGLAAEGIEVLDPRPAFRAAAEPLYWPEDHHLSTAGHARLAEWLSGEIRRRLDTR